MSQFKKLRDEIIIELNKRIDDANNIDDHEQVYALENFREWLFENYVY